MAVTWVVVVRADRATVFEYEKDLRRIIRIDVGLRTRDEFVRRIAARLEREAAYEEPTSIVLLSAPTHIHALRCALPPTLSTRVQFASAAIH